MSISIHIACVNLSLSKIICLVVSTYPEKYKSEFVSWEYEIPIWKIIHSCSKPPTRILCCNHPSRMIRPPGVALPSPILTPI